MDGGWSAAMPAPACRAPSRTGWRLRERSR
jgi:hypothetical protein